MQICPKEKGLISHNQNVIIPIVESQAKDKGRTMPGQLSKSSLIELGLWRRWIDTQLWGECIVWYLLRHLRQNGLNN